MKNNFDPSSEIAIGIDLGTTYCCVAVCRNKKVEIIPNENGYRITPSYVSFTDHKRLIGDSAKDHLLRNSENTVYNIKRLMGRKWNDELLQNEIKKFSFDVVEKDSLPQVQIKTKKTRYFTAEEICAMILKALTKVAEKYLNKKVKNVVITVPAYFNDAQRQATVNAGTIAGLNVLKILNEPTAAAIAYGRNSVVGSKIIAIYDLGGGTLDVSIMKIEDSNFTVLATSGNTHLGGEDFDQNVVNYFVNLYKTKKKKDISKNKRALQRLRKEIETAKKTLTFASTSEMTIVNLVDDEDFEEILTRAKFEELNKNLFIDTLKPLKQALDDAKLTKDQIDEVIMVGGSSRIPKIRELVKEFFGGKEPFQKINPDEAIASGAAIHAGVLSGQDDSIVLFDVNAISLGIENSDNTISVIIPRNTILPVRRTQMRTTSEDFQTTAQFAVYEGELPLAKDNLLLGTFKLTNIENAVKGIPRFATTFEIDENGILHVSAQDIKTKEKMSITINWDKRRPTVEQIEYMIKISEEYDIIDEQFKKCANPRMEFSERLYLVRHNLDQKNLTSTEKRQLTLIIDKNIEWLDKNTISDPEEFQRRKEKFEEDVKKIKYNYFDKL